MYASSSESRRWAGLASLVVLAALVGTLWYLAGGCEAERSAPSDGDGAARHILVIVGAMKDPNVIDLSLHVAWFHARAGRLPESLEDLAPVIRETGWPATPAATTDGIGLAYRPRGDRAYDVILLGHDGQMGTEDDVVVPQEAPAGGPPTLTAETYQVWWALKQVEWINALLAASEAALP